MKFRIIEELWYDNEFNEEVVYYVQEWKSNWLGQYKWRYWLKWDYQEQRTFKSIKNAKSQIEKYVNRQQHEIVIEELVY